MGVSPLNPLIFPIPDPAFYDSSHSNLIWIPRSPSSLHSPNTKNPKYSIPCIYIPSPKKSSVLMLFFHGNAEDAGCSDKFLKGFLIQFNFNILIIEYPGYGPYRGKNPSGNKIRKDINIIYNHITKVMNIKEENIIIFGRSLGSGPAIYLATIFNPFC